MRYEGCLLTEDQSRALIDDVDLWCRRTGTNYNKLVIAAGVGVTTRHKVRMKGQRITLKVAARLRDAMRKHGSGISREEYRSVEKPWRREVKILASDFVGLTRASSEICHRCGSRYGRCEHTLSANGLRSSFG